MSVGRTQHAKRTRRRNDDQRICLAATDRFIEMFADLLQEFVFGLLVPVGLLDGAAARSG
jgi:hypothetical protein